MVEDQIDENVRSNLSNVHDVKETLIETTNLSVSGRRLLTQRRATISRSISFSGVKIVSDDDQSKFLKVSSKTKSEPAAEGNHGNSNNRNSDKSSNSGNASSQHSEVNPDATTYVRSFENPEHSESDDDGKERGENHLNYRKHKYGHGHESHDGDGDADVYMDDSNEIHRPSLKSKKFATLDSDSIGK